MFGVLIIPMISIF